MEKQVLRPKKLADTGGRYSHAILASGRLLFIAGQTAMNEKGEVVGKGDVRAQARQVFENIRAALAEVDATMENIVEIKTYLTDVRHRDAVHEVRVQYFPKDPPTSTLLGISALANPDYLIEVDAIAVV